MHLRFFLFCILLSRYIFPFTAKFCREEIDNETVDSSSNECVPKYLNCTSRCNSTKGERKRYQYSHDKTTEVPRDGKTKDRVVGIGSCESNDNTDEDPITEYRPHHRRSPNIGKGFRWEPDTDETSNYTERDCDEKSLFRMKMVCHRKKVKK